MTTKNDKKVGNKQQFWFFRNRVLLLLIVLLALVFPGCGPRNVYEGMRLHQGMDCQKLHGTDQDECNRRSGMSYDEYERQRNREEQRR